MKTEKWPNFKKPPTGKFDEEAFNRAYNELQPQSHLTDADAKKLAEHVNLNLTYLCGNEKNRYGGRKENHSEPA